MLREEMEGKLCREREMWGKKMKKRSLPVPLWLLCKFMECVVTQWSNDMERVTYAPFTATMETGWTAVSRPMPVL